MRTVSQNRGAEPSAKEPSPLLIPRPYRVVGKVEEVPDIFTLHLVPTSGGLPSFEPAQVSMLGSFGVGEAAISISSTKQTTEYHAYTIRRAGPISNALADTEIGGTVTVRGPFGRPWPLDDVKTSQLVIIGGGLGIAPLRAVIQEAVVQSSRFDRLVVAYGAKSPDLIVYAEDLDRWAGEGVEVVLTVDEGSETWDHAVGVAPALLGSSGSIEMTWADTTAFVCGPDVMMHFSADSLI